MALLERELLRANAEAAASSSPATSTDGCALCVERWGGDDGPDDAIENFNDWPILHALGGADEVLALYKKAWEGHLRQYTLAKTTRGPVRAGTACTTKSSHVMFDWLHNGEGLARSSCRASPTRRPRVPRRARRFAGFYMDEDPAAPNYDPSTRSSAACSTAAAGRCSARRRRSTGPATRSRSRTASRPATARRSYEEMLDHFQDYNDIVGDHPQNLLATTLALNAYALTGEAKYRDWCSSTSTPGASGMPANGGIIPTNVGLDGKIGGGGGRQVVRRRLRLGLHRRRCRRPAGSAHRNTHHLGLNGFGNAFLLTGDDATSTPGAG